MKTDTETGTPDDFVREAAEAAGVTVEQFLATLKGYAQLSENRSECLQPHELENWRNLPQERQAHVKKCSFCSTLLHGAMPDEAEARRYAEKAARTVT